MKSNTHATLALFLCAVILSASCGKDYNSAPQNGYTPDAEVLNKLFASLKPTPQTISVPAGIPSSVTAANGTVMNFNANSFKDANGNTITSGTVKVEVTEMYKPGDMIANRASTMANGKILKSGGQLNITASINGKPVFANKFGVEFVQQAASSSPMSLFYGNTDNTYGVTTWTNAGSAINIGTIATSTTIVNGEQHYIFDSCTQFGWTNCDQFYNTDSPLTSVSIIMPDKTFTPANTQIYLVLPETRSVMTNVDPRSTDIGGATYDPKTFIINLISEGHTNIVPTGMKYTLLAIANKDGKFYYSASSGIITKDLKQSATMVLKTKDEVTTLLAAL